jgi:hypothetical protein
MTDKEELTAVAGDLVNTVFRFKSCVLTTEVSRFLVSAILTGVIPYKTAVPTHTVMNPKHR